MHLFELPMPARERILCRITQLPKGGSSAFAELYVEPDCSNKVFVGIYKPPPSSQSFTPHPQLVNIRLAATKLSARSIPSRLIGFLPTSDKAARSDRPRGTTRARYQEGKPRRCGEARRA